MQETWLRPNRRAIAFGCVLPAGVVVLGSWLALRPAESAAPTTRWIGGCLIIGGLALVVALARQLRRPRIAYRDGQVLFYLRAGRPIAVPAASVEAFFVGRGPTDLPGALGRHDAMNLVARISRRATEWLEQDVTLSLGHWCDGYVTIRGTWCEPLSGEVVRRLNRRLKEVQTEAPNVC